MRRIAAAALVLLAPAGCSFLLNDKFSGGDVALEAGADVAAPSDAGPTSPVESGPDAREGGAVDPYFDAVMADSPVGFWRLDESSGTTFKDETGRRSLTLIHPDHALVGEAPAVHGRAITLDGNTELRIGGTIDFPPEKTFTIEAWIRPTDIADNYRRVFSKVTIGPNGPLDGSYLWVNGGRKAIGFERWREGVAQDEVYWDTRLGADAFTHLVVVVDGVRTKMYGDAKLRGTAVHEPQPSANPDVEMSWGFNFGGGLDELAFYEVPLTPERVKAHYDAATRR